jgi:rod shape-determining protein MreB and related proteins
MDESIRDYVRSNYCLQIGEYTAEALKRELGALRDDEIPSDERKVQLVGKQLSDGSACAVHITAEEVRDALEPVITEIVTGIRRIIEDAQPEAVADIYYSGMILTGGGSLLKGLRDRLQNELQLRATMPEDPISTVVLGAGILLDEPEHLYRCAIRPNLPVWQEAEELVTRFT